MCYSIETTLKSEIRKLEKVCIYTVYRPAIPLILDTSFFFEVWKKGTKVQIEKYALRHFMFKL